MEAPSESLELRAALDAAVAASARDFFETRRARIDGFARRRFSLRGALRLNRRALGWDMARAPANLALAPANLALRATAQGLSAVGARRAGAALGRRRLLLDTAVARETRRLIVAELLELPTEGDPHDALAEAILADPRVRAVVAGRAPELAAALADPARRARLSAALEDYAGVRNAAAEVTTALATLGAGAAAFQSLTPGALSLGPALAGALAHSAAVSAFPLGAAAGGAWYALFPVAVPASLAVGATVGVMAAAAAVAAFAGVLADPAQTALGLHQRRLRRLIDALEAEFLSDAGPGFAAREHYVARLLDLADAAFAAARALRGG
jgi:hypothetical protein